MRFFICEYLSFKCKIGIDKDNEHILEKFAHDFSLYYNITRTNKDEPCDININIVEDAFNDIKLDKCICIHSSHSKNIKYLLDGSIYKQIDAKIVADASITDTEAFYYIEKTNSKIYANLKQNTIHFSSEDIYNTLMYIYETLLVNYIESRGGVICHAACVKLKEDGILITGKSGGGKTTLLFNSIEKGGLFHSNDRVAIFEKNNDIYACAIPIPVNVPIKVMKGLAAWSSNNLILSAQPNTKIRFLVSQLNLLFSDNIIKCVKINKVVSVNFSDTLPEYKKLSHTEFCKYVEILTPFDENHPRWLPFFEIPTKDEINEKIECIAKNVKLVKVSGRDTFTTMMGETT